MPHVLKKKEVKAKEITEIPQVLKKLGFELVRVSRVPEEYSKGLEHHPGSAKVMKLGLGIPGYFAPKSGESITEAEISGNVIIIVTSDREVLEITINRRNNSATVKNYSMGKPGEQETTYDLAKS